MRQSKKLQFSYNTIYFEAVVTFNDSPFKDARNLNTSVFYDVKLMKPEILECGGNVIQFSGIMSLMLFSGQVADRHYIYKEDFDINKESENINVYPSAIEKILYVFFNKDQIAHYKQKISLFKNVLDKKYEPDLQALQKEKLALRATMKSGEIDSKVYQKQYKPIRLKKEELELKIFWIQHNYKKQYFECCELKSRYRSVLPQKKMSCNDTYILCGVTKFLAKTKIDLENNKKQT